MRRALIPIVALLLVGLLTLGLTQAGGGDDPAPRAAAFDLAEARRELAGAPAPLASLHAQAGKLLGGGRQAYRRRLASLEGHPVVVNKWASWCNPCRVEFPYFQALGTREGKRVAFLGVDSRDSSGPAERFLADMPLPYPSYVDPEGEIAGLLGPSAFPVTAFYDERGKLAYLHQGAYRSESDLAADIRRYL